MASLNNVHYTASVSSQTAKTHNLHAPTPWKPRYRTHFPFQPYGAIRHTILTSASCNLYSHCLEPAVTVPLCCREVIVSVISPTKEVTKGRPCAYDLYYMLPSTIRPFSPRRVLGPRATVDSSEECGGQSRTRTLPANIAVRCRCITWYLFLNSYWQQPVLNVEAENRLNLKKIQHRHGKGNNTRQRYHARRGRQNYHTRELVHSPHCSVKHSQCPRSPRHGLEGTYSPEAPAMMASHALMLSSTRIYFSSM